MSEPLDLEPIRERLYVTGWQSDLGRIDDFDALVAEVERLRGEAESEARARRFNSKMSNYLMDVIGRDEPEVREAEARIKAGDNHSEENSFGHIAAAYIMRLRGEVARQEIDRAFYELVVKERDLERARVDRLTRERDEARGELARQAEQITAIRALHREVIHGEGVFCHQDDWNYPCPTITALDGGTS